jgi:SRSO17 transposase
MGRGRPPHAGAAEYGVLIPPVAPGIDDITLQVTRVYLPKDWTVDPERCRKIGAPVECLVFKIKDEIALDIVQHAHRIGMDFGWVGADAGYGKDLLFF